MASNLSGVVLAQPTTTVNIALGESFQMEIYGTFVGGGSPNAYDLIHQWDQGTDTWATIPASSQTTGLYTDGDPDILNETTTAYDSGSTRTITVYGDKIGTYYVRAYGYRGGEYTDGPVQVNVTSTDRLVDVYDSVSTEDSPAGRGGDEDASAYSEVSVTEDVGVAVVADAEDISIDTYDEVSVAEETSPYVKSYVELQLSNYIPDSASEPTTARMTPPSGKTTGNFEAGKITDDTNPLPSIDLTSDAYTEVEWCIIITDMNEDGDRFEFRVISNDWKFPKYRVAPTVVQAYPVNLYESTSVTEDVTVTLLSGTLSVSVSDEVTVTEDINMQPSDLAVEANDEVSIVDAASLSPVLFISVVSEVAAEEDIAAAASELQPAVFDGVTVVESTSVSVVTTAPLSIDTFDAVSIADAVEAAITTLSCSVIDNIITADFVDAVTSALDISKFEEVTVTESAGVDVGAQEALNVSVFETSSLSEAVTQNTLLGQLQVYDSIAITESVTGINGTIPASVHDTVSVLDTANTAVDINAETSDAVTVVEDVSLLSVITVNIYDNVSVAEEVSEFIEINAVAVDVVTVTDVAYTGSGLQIICADTVLVSEFIADSLSLSAQATDTVSITDNITMYPPMLAASVLDRITVTEYSKVFWRYAEGSLRLTIQAMLADTDINCFSAIADNQAMIAAEEVNCYSATVTASGLTAIVEAEVAY